jgi:hypothetical protein
MAEATGVAILFLQGAIFALFVVAVRRGNTAAAINAVAAFLVALLPTVTEIALEAFLVRGVAFGPMLPIWIAGAGVLHSLGMLGLYESTWWWDHLTHTISAALLAALLYAAVIVSFSTSFGVWSASSTLMIVTVVFTFAVGILWELIELVAREIGERVDIEPVLVHYGWRDTAADLAFDLIGALLVLGADIRMFVPVFEPFPGLTGAILVGSGCLVISGSVLMAVIVWLGDAITF